MSTFLYELVSELDENWKEVDLLLQEAQKLQNSHLDLYNAICRSITVLIVAHLEGFTKELVRAIIHDFNRNCTFKDLPSSVQRTYCKKYLGVDGDTNSKNYKIKVSVLTEKFCDVECKISHEPFLLRSNDNPNPDAISKIFQNFGVRSVFSHLHESKVDSVFYESNKTTKDDIEKQKIYILNAVDTYPYSCNLSRINLNKFIGEMPKRTLWQEFLDHINMIRHGVAHGSDLDNSESVSMLEARKDKVVYLQLALIELMAGFLSNESKVLK